MVPASACNGGLGASSDRHPHHDDAGDHQEPERELLPMRRDDAHLMARVPDVGHAEHERGEEQSAFEDVCEVVERHDAPKAGPPMARRAGPR